MREPVASPEPREPPPATAESAATRHDVVLSLSEVGVCYQRRRGVLSRSVARLWALRDVSLELRRGETLGVIGRNGAGKTTLLRLLAGIIRPDRGELVNHGYRVALLSLQVGFLQHLSGRENVILSALLLGMTRREVEQKMDAIIDFAELGDFIDDPIQTYSTGMRARLGFSTAFHVDPAVLLIDEVLGVGDAEFVEKSKAVMRERIRSEKTVVLVSHSAESIRSLTDRAVWIEKGRSVLEGPPSAVLEAYERTIRRPDGDAPAP